MSILFKLWKLLRKTYCAKFIKDVIYHGGFIVIVSLFIPVYWHQDFTLERNFGYDYATWNDVGVSAYYKSTYFEWVKLISTYSIQTHRNYP